MNKFYLELSFEELGIVFQCLMCSALCPPEYGELINRVFKMIRDNDITGDMLYSGCPDFKRKL